MKRLGCTVMISDFASNYQQTLIPSGSPASPRPVLEDQWDLESAYLTNMSKMQSDFLKLARDVNPDVVCAALLVLVCTLAAAFWTICRSCKVFLDSPAC